MQWWTGKRGEWYVVGQVALMALVFFGPRTWGGWPERPAPLATLRLIVGAALALLGAALFLAGILRLGRNLTPLPHPREHSTLIQSGPYQLVRHPMYGGGLGIALGWALLVGSWCTLAYVVLLFVFLDIKSRREERWLVERFPGYADYQRRVRKLVPFIY
jgi:protein-S-isoprenylcysteine O-methyltransferase Ste14